MSEAEIPGVDMEVPGAKPTAATRLARYLVAVLAIGIGLEAGARHWEPLLRAASYRSLFKARLLEQRLPQDVIFFGTSRTASIESRSVGDGLLERGAPRLSVFPLSVPSGTLDTLHAIASRFASAPGLKLAVIEISKHQLMRSTVPWEREPGSQPPDFDSRAMSILESHSALIAQWKVFVLDSLARLAALAWFGRRFDGTEYHAVDYMASVFGSHPDADPERFAAVDCRPRPVDDAAAELHAYVEERDEYLAIARAFSERGVHVAFLVPPTSGAESGPENSPEHRQLRASLHAITGKPVWDFSTCVLPTGYFRDWIHLTPLGAAHFSRFVARAIADDDEIAPALGIPRSSPISRRPDGP